MGKPARRWRLIGSRAGDGLGEPEPYNFTRDVVETLAVDKRRGAVRFVDDEGVIDRRTFDEIATASGQWAALLRARGLVPGDRVVVRLGPTPFWPAVLLGALKAGFVVAPCSESTSNDDLQRLLVSSGARLLVVDRDHVGAVGSDAAVEVIVCEDAALELRGLVAVQPTHDTMASDPALILLAAGGREEPLSHGFMRDELGQAGTGLDVWPDDLVWCAAETGTAASLWDGLLVPWAAAAEIVIDSTAFDAARRIELIDRLGVTVLRQSPDEYRQMAEQRIENGELDGLRRAVSVGDPLDPDVAEALRAMCGLTVEEEPGDGVGSPEPPVAAANGLVDVLHDRVGAATTPNGHVVSTPDSAIEDVPEGQPSPVQAPEAPLAALGAAAIGLDEQVARDEAAEAHARRIEDERRDAERRAAEQRQTEEERRAAEAKAKDDERRRKEAEKEAAKEAKLAAQRAEEEQRAAAIQAETDERERKRQEAAAAAEAQRSTTEARRAAEAKAKADERERKKHEKEAAEEGKLAAQRAEEERRAAAAQAEADERERKQREAAAAAEAQRAAEEERRAAEAKAKDDERRRKEAEKEAAKEAKLAAKRAEEEQRAAAVQAEADERERKQREAAAAAEAQRAAEEARRAAEAKAKDDERRRKEQEKEAAKEAKLAVKRAEEEGRAAAVQAEADERERKRQEAAAAADAQRAAAEERRAAEAKAKDEERERKQQEKEAAAQARRAKAERARPESPAEPPEPIAAAAANGSEEPEPDDGPNEMLIQRLRAYTHHADDVTAEPPPQ